MTFVVIMHQCSPGELGVSQPHRVVMILECSTGGELLARAAFMHHDDQEGDALRHDAILKGLMHYLDQYGLYRSTGELCLHMTTTRITYLSTMWPLKVTCIIIKMLKMQISEFGGVIKRSMAGRGG